MGKPKRNILAAAEESSTPPDQLTESQSLARVVKAEGNNLYAVTLPNKKPLLVELEPRFRNTIWIKRGGYVLIDVASSSEERPPNSKVVGEIINVVRDEKAWRKLPYWPKPFAKNTYDDEDDDESTVGKMPPSDSEDED
ncbi:hypothetical protein B0T25DRAFT_454966 [Lasiosphaeria hispida]|uniref:S1-like domain-containing protein n=1 Tax=Lasiosphaeria hispida TaxID=260671 RepID=A0AAJ0HH01_9PEZI|nr:hypothetical protein B0T25DRAFT_454966 [Lasiosphaeria hispida]